MGIVLIKDILEILELNVKAKMEYSLILMSMVSIALKVSVFYFHQRKCEIGLSSPGRKEIY